MPVWLLLSDLLHKLWAPEQLTSWVMCYKQHRLCLPKFLSNKFVQTPRRHKALPLAETQGWGHPLSPQHEALPLAEAWDRATHCPHHETLLQRLGDGATHCPRGSRSGPPQNPQCQSPALCKKIAPHMWPRGWERNRNSPNGLGDSTRLLMTKKRKPVKSLDSKSLISLQLFLKSAMILTNFMGKYIASLQFPEYKKQ